MKKNKNMNSRNKRNKRNHNTNKHNSNIANISFNKVILFAILALIITSLIFLLFRLNKSKTIEVSSLDTNIVDNSISINDYFNIYASTNDESLNTTTNSSSTSTTEKLSTTFNITAIGDIMCHNTQYIDAYDSTTGLYDFDYVFDNISYYLKTADIAVGNLETCFAGSEVGYSSYPTFNTPSSLASSLKSIGLDVLSTANNHSMDTSYSRIMLNYRCIR